MDKNLLILVVSSFKALSVVFLTTVLTLPLGLGLIRIFRISYNPNSRLSLAFALGFIAQALTVFLIHYLGLQSFAYQHSYLGLVPILLLVIFRVSFTSTEKRILAFVFVAAVLYSHLLVFPSAEKVTAESARILNGYYSDNLISFNTARIFTEGLSVKDIIVVPVWTFFDRTPVAGTLVAYLWFFLGLKEKAIWLSSTGDNFLFYQVQLIFLNLLSLLALAGFLLRKSKRVLPTLLILLLAPFVFLNMSFAWPKYLSAFFAIVGLDLLSEDNQEKIKSYKELILAGVLLGFAYLTHDLAIFFLAMLFCVLFLLVIFNKLINFKQFSLLFFGLLLAATPWFVFKAVYETKSSHMYALHLFCIRDFSYQDLNFNDALTNYLQTHSYADIFKTKLGNLTYPYSIIDFFKSLRGNFYDFAEWIKISAVLSKYQFIHALTVPVFLLALYGLFISRSKYELNWWFVIAGLLSIIPAALISGCEKSTWNHAWAYIPSLLLALPLGFVFNRYKLLFIVAGLSCIISTAKLLTLQADFFNQASFAYLFWFGFLSMVLLNLIYFEKCSLD